MKYSLSVGLVVAVASGLWLSAAVVQTEESQIEGNLYTNIRLGFSFLFPSGWDVQILCCSRFLRTYPTLQLRRRGSQPEGNG